MNVSRMLLLSAALAIATSCHPSQKELEKADYGSYPENYETIVKAFYHDYLKDPDSAKFDRISVPVTMYWGSRFGDLKYGWRTCVTVNAKNSYGAYTGYKTDALLIKDGRVIDYLPDSLIGGKNACAAKGL